MTGAYHKFPVTAIAKTMGMGNVIVATIGSEMMKMMRMGSDDILDRIENKSPKNEVHNCTVLWRPTKGGYDFNEASDESVDV